ncbi:MAG: alanine racemase, partial [Ilumatobacter sp.]
MTSTTDVSSTADLRTPALVVDRQAFDANVAAMSAVRPGRSLRPHVKAFKSTALARELVAAGHPTFCAATPREIEGLALAGVGDDLLLANESFDVARLGALSDRTDAVITVAVDSDEILDAAIDGGVRSVLLDIDVGLPRCGCDIDTAERLAERARGAGLDVRGVMGYEGHLMMMENGDDKTRKVGEAMAILLAASERIGGDIVSGGGTGTYATNTWCTEIQAGSYTLLDTEYATLDSPFEPALRVLATVVSTSAKGWIIADAGLKAFGMDHGAPTWDGPGKVLYCSDEHVTLIPDDVG